MKFANVRMVMDGAGDGTGASGGSGGSASAALGNSGQSAGGTTSTSQAAAPAAASGGGQGQSASSWVESFSDGELRGFIQNKGFDKAETLAHSYRELEKTIGMPKERILHLPKDMSEAGAMEAIYNRLGRPDKPEGYEFHTPEKGGNEKFTAWAREHFHKAGLTKTQAKAITESFNNYLDGAQKEVKAEYDAKIANSDKELRQKWGQAYEQNIEIGKRAVAKFGVEAADIDAIENALGYNKTLELFQRIGEGLGEHEFVSPNSGGQGFGKKMTPDQAISMINEKAKDSEFLKKLSAGDTATVKEWDALNAAAYHQAG